MSMVRCDPTWSGRPGVPSLQGGGLWSSQGRTGGREGGSRVRGVWVTLQMPRGAAVCTVSPSWWRRSPHGVPEGGG